MTWYIWSTCNTNWKITSLAYSFGKELKITGTEKLNNDILVDAGINIIGKKIKNGISLVTSSGITLTDHEIKDIIKVITINDSWFIINEKCTHSIS